MMRQASGLLSELSLVRMHGRTAEYLEATNAGRAAIVSACRNEATVHDLAERILSRTIYAQASSRVGPLRELVQNALDASAHGGRIDIRSSVGERTSLDIASEHHRVITVSDHGRGMTRTELLEDLLVPFRSGKEGEPEAIGEHGIGFLSALEIAPRLEVTTVTSNGAYRLTIEPVGERAPYADFAWSICPCEARSAVTGTIVRLSLAQPIHCAMLAAEIASAAGFVDPARARIFVNDVLINTARLSLRKVARMPIGHDGALGELFLLVGRGEGIPAQLLVTQRGLLVTARKDAFVGPALSLHREIARAIMAAGYGIVIELPLSVPLNKGRSAVAASASGAVGEAVVSAFERFVLEDALYDREMLRGVDHRLSSVLDRLVNAALLGDSTSAQPAPSSTDEPPSRDRPRTYAPSTPDEQGTPSTRTPTVAAPEEVVRFADALLDRPMFTAAHFDAERCESRQLYTLRAILMAFRESRLRPMGDGQLPGNLYLSLADPLAQALWRRLRAVSAAHHTAPQSARVSTTVSMQRILRHDLHRVSIPGVDVLSAAMAILEQIDQAISAAAGLHPSPISVHQDLYGPDEMAHTDGTGISVNLASPRIRTLLVAVLADDDPIAFGALCDLLLHEKTHVSLASYVPRPTAEHGATFYRRKDCLRRLLLEAVSTGSIADPITCLPLARRGLASLTLPSPELLARTFATAPIAA